VVDGYLYDPNAVHLTGSKALTKVGWPPKKLVALIQHSSKLKPQPLDPSDSLGAGTWTAGTDRIRFVLRTVLARNCPDCASHW
jgi:hypothetical protein